MFHICHNGAICANTPGHFTCTCVSGWTGTQCHDGIFVNIINNVLVIQRAKPQTEYTLKQRVT